jgi:hypothetical protein
MLARYRQKDTLPIVLPFIQGVLTEYFSASPESRDYRKKDGALVAIAVLAKVRNTSSRCRLFSLIFYFSVWVLFCVDLCTIP